MSKLAESEPSSLVLEPTPVATAEVARGDLGEESFVESMEEALLERVRSSPAVDEILGVTVERVKVPSEFEAGELSGEICVLVATVDWIAVEWAAVDELETPKLRSVDV